MKFDQVVIRACADFNWKWPKELTSGVMFFEGQRITILEFNYHLSLVGN